MKKYLLLVLLSVSTTILAQNPVKINFQFLNNNAPFMLDQPIVDLAGMTYSAQEIAFYISNLKITHDGGQVLDFQDSVFYINIRYSLCDLGVFNVDQVEAIDFMVGVPLSLNHTDISAYPEKHPLSFQTPSMHWEWLAGYTFFLIHGTADSDADALPDALFEIQCLGDSNTQQVHVDNRATILSDGTREIIQFVNIDQWIRGVNLATIGQLHGSTGQNATVMLNVQNYPVFTAPLNAGLNEVSEYLGNATFKTNQGNSLLTWNGMKNLSRVELLSSNGTLINGINTHEINGVKNYQLASSGIYLVRFFNENGLVINQMKVVCP